MLKLIKKLFGIKEDEPHPAFCEHQQRMKEKWLAEEARKAEWEADNELKKKHDAAYLGTKHNAYYGTYEEWDREQSREALRMLASYRNQPNAIYQTHPSQLASNAIYPIYRGYPF
jgi:hypothetical protein